MKNYSKILSMVAISLVAGSTIAIIGSIPTAHAIEKGSIVTFLIKASDVAELGGFIPPDSMLIFPQDPSATTIDMINCGTGSFPAQQSILVIEGQGSKHLDAVVTSESEPVPAGTRLSNISKVETCTDDGTDYVKFKGTVQ